MWLSLIKQPWTLAGRPKGDQHIGVCDICRAGFQIKVVNQTLYLFFSEPFDDTLKGPVFFWVFGFASWQFRRTCTVYRLCSFCRIFPGSLTSTKGKRHLSPLQVNPKITEHFAAS